MTIDDYGGGIDLKKSVKNLIFGIASQAINIVMGFILPYLFISNLGSEANGLLSSMGQLFIYLNLLEAGVGATSLQALYKSVADNDCSSINSKLVAASKHYHKTGRYYFLAIILLTIIYPYIIESDINTETIMLAVFLQGCGSLISYSIRSVYILLLQAEGDIYVISILQLASSALRNLGKVIVIYINGGIIGIQLVQLLSILFETICVYLYIHKKYSWIDLKVSPDFSGLKQSKAALIKTVSFLVFNRTDIIVITLISRDLKLVSVYSVYSLVFEAIQNISDTICNSYQYKIGQISQTSVNQFREYYQKYRIISSYVIFLLNSVGFLLIIPFLRIYTKEVTDINYIITWLPELFFVMKVLYGIRSVHKQAVDAVGHFQKTQIIAIVEMIINLVTSIGLIYLFDIRGVVLGTIIALLVGVVAYIKYVNRNILNCKDVKFSILLSVMCVLIVLVIFINRFLGVNCTTYYELIKYALFVLIIIGALNLSIYFIIKALKHKHI